MRMGWVILLAVVGLVVGAILAFMQPVLAIVLFALVILVTVGFARRGLAIPGINGWVVLAAPLIAAGSISWLVARLIWGLAGARTPAPPPTITDPMNSAQRSDVLTYARSLTFAEDLDSTRYEYHGQYDSNLIDTLGTMVIVAPEENIHRTRRKDFDRGRIQLRIKIIQRSGRPPTERYDSLPPGVTYVWVDQVVMTDSRHGKIRAVFVPEDARFDVWSETIDYVKTRVWNQAVARWTPGTCWSCELTGWCH